MFSKAFHVTCDIFSNVCSLPRGENHWELLAEVEISMVEPTNARCSVDWVTHHTYLMNSAGSMYELLYGGKTGRLAGNGYWKCFKLMDSMARSMTSQPSDLSILFSFH